MRRDIEDMVRETAHKELDKALEMYFNGAPLWIVTQCGWTGAGVSDEMRITISERTL